MESKMLSFWNSEREKSGDIIFRQVQSDDDDFGNQNKPRISFEMLRHSSQVTRCHWFLLAPISPLILKMRSDMSKAHLDSKQFITVLGVTESATKAITDFVYGIPLKSDFSVVTVRQIRWLAHELEIELLKQACADWLLSHLSLDFVWESLADACQWHDEALKYKSLGLIRTVPGVFQIHVGVTTVTLLEVVQLSSLPVTEETLFRFINAIAQKNKEIEVDKIVPYIRFTSMDAPFFYTEVMTSGLLGKDSTRICRLLATGNMENRRPQTPMAVIMNTTISDATPARVGFLTTDTVLEYKERIKCVLPLKEFQLINDEGLVLTDGTKCDGHILNGSMLFVHKMVNLGFRKIGEKDFPDQAQFLLIKETLSFKDIALTLSETNASAISFLHVIANGVIGLDQTPNDLNLKDGDVLFYF